MLRHMVKTLADQRGYEIKRKKPDREVPEHVRAFIRKMWPVCIGLPLIRLGGSGDGAYILPDDFEGVKALFSPGVDVLAGFEADMASRGITCYMADASVANPPMQNEAFHFISKYLGISSDDVFIRIDDWVAENEPGDYDLILQMDIEGAEWVVLANASDDLIRRFRIIVLELHSVNNLLDEYARPTIMQVLSRLLETHHLVHNHPNNCGQSFCESGLVVPEVLEITFLRKDRAKASGYVTEFPHPLDIVNDPMRPEQPLPESWHANSRQ